MVYVVYHLYQNNLLLTNISERLAEYGWKPRRAASGQTNPSRASIRWHVRETQTGTVSSNLRLQTLLFVFLCVSFVFSRETPVFCRVGINNDNNTSTVFRTV